VPLYAEDRVALFAADHRLARAKSISITQLRDDPVVMHRGATEAWEAFHNQNPRPDGHVAPRGRPQATSRRSSRSSPRARRSASCRARSPPPRGCQPGVATVPVRHIPPTQVCLAWNGARHARLVAGFADAARDVTKG
jgi:hypothetical protein